MFAVLMTKCKAVLQKVFHLLVSSWDCLAFKKEEEFLLEDEVFLGNWFNRDRTNGQRYNDRQVQVKKELCVLNVLLQ